MNWLGQERPWKDRTLTWISRVVLLKLSLMALPWAARPARMMTPSAGSLSSA